MSTAIPLRSVLSGTPVRGQEAEETWMMEEDMSDRDKLRSERVSKIISAAIVGAATLLHSGQAIEAVAVIAAGLFIVAVLYGR